KVTPGKNTAVKKPAPQEPAIPGGYIEELPPWYERAFAWGKHTAAKGLELSDEALELSEGLPSTFGGPVIGKLRGPLKGVRKVPNFCTTPNKGQPNFPTNILLSLEFIG
ncbi:hypothetical protein, partial [Thermodesulfitimonas autotrophica]|uniref:hypothetical protein n=1 Tax=Thermodesulfitimonas autotrophica TaxID=1894989 RepID=UPI002FDFEF4F